MAALKAHRVDTDLWDNSHAYGEEETNWPHTVFNITSYDKSHSRWLTYKLFFNVSSYSVSRVTCFSVIYSPWLPKLTCMMKEFDGLTFTFLKSIFLVFFELYFLSFFFPFWHLSMGALSSALHLWSRYKTCILLQDMCKSSTKFTLFMPLTCLVALLSFAPPKGNCSKAEMGTKAPAYLFLFRCKGRVVLYGLLRYDKLEAKKWLTCLLQGEPSSSIN